VEKGPSDYPFAALGRRNDTRTFRASGACERGVFAFCDDRGRGGVAVTDARILLCTILARWRGARPQRAGRADGKNRDRQIIWLRRRRRVRHYARRTPRPISACTVLLLSLRVLLSLLLVPHRVRTVYISTRYAACTYTLSDDALGIIIIIMILCVCAAITPSP